MIAHCLETDPRPQGWIYQDDRLHPIAEGGLARTGGIEPAAGTGSQWRSPGWTQAAFDYYRVSFSARSPRGASASIWVSGTGYHPKATWGRFFRNGGFNHSTGRLWDDDWAPYPIDGDWKDFVYFSRVRPNAARTAVVFWDFEGGDAQVRQLSVSPAKGPEVLDWADRTYASLPPFEAPFPANRHQRLARSMARLESGGTLRIVFVGDSIVADMANSCLDLLLERACPGARVLLSTAGASSTGMDGWDRLEPAEPTWPEGKDIRLSAAVVDQAPDLVLLGGICNGSGAGKHFRGVIDKLRETSRARHGFAPEIVVATAPHPYGRDSAGHRAALESLAVEKSAAFLDLHSPLRAYFEALPSTGGRADDFYRDPVHANLRGKQLLGRVLLAWLRPEPGPMQPAQPSNRAR